MLFPPLAGLDTKSAISSTLPVVLFNESMIRFSFKLVMINTTQIKETAMIRITSLMIAIIVAISVVIRLLAPIIRWNHPSMYLKTAAT